jgi:hypothetical protein
MSKFRVGGVANLKVFGVRSLAAFVACYRVDGER